MVHISGAVIAFPVSGLRLNCGFEGDTDDPAVAVFRRRQAKNFIAILMISRGVPMLLTGDEIWRTQRGNNNAWCQDNELSWFDWTTSSPGLIGAWSLVESDRDMFEFAQGRLHCAGAIRASFVTLFSPSSRYQAGIFQISHGTDYG